MGETPPIAELWTSLWQVSCTSDWFWQSKGSFLFCKWISGSGPFFWSECLFYVTLHLLLIGTCLFWLAIHPMSLGGVINCSLQWHNTLILLKSSTLIHECFVRSVGLSQRMFNLQQLHLKKLLHYWCLLYFVTVLRILGIAFVSCVRFWEEHLESSSFSVALNIE